MYGFDTKTASFPDDFLARVTFGNGGRDFNRQVIGPHLKGKAGIFSHAVAGNDAAIFDDGVPALPVFHSGKDAPDNR